MKQAQLQSAVCAAAMAAVLGLWSPPALAQAETPPPQGTSRGENFSAKPAPQLFASDCTGSGCHKGPQGLGKNLSQLGLTSFLREHYTNSRESASALAAFLMRSPGASAPAEARTPRTHPGAQSSRAAARPEEATPAAPAAPARRTAEPNEGAQKPAPAARGQRGRHTTAATPAPVVPPEPTPPPAPPPPPKQYDIFD